jgi:ABC-2 type transport system permease protein
MRAVLGVELRKLVAQWRVRVALLVVVLLPPFVSLVLTFQSGSPTDTLYGRWVHDVGLSIPLVLLGSAAYWGIPVLASLVAGEVLATEDQQGTWATLLARSRSRWQLFSGKAMAAAVATVVMVVLLGASAVLSGLVAGTEPLVGLTGQPLDFGEGLGLVVLAWLSTLPTALAVCAGALLASATSRNNVIGVVAPSLVAGALGLVSMVAPLGAVRPALLMPGLTAWHGLLQQPADSDAVIVAALVALVWTLVLLYATVLVLSRRDWAVP